MTMALWLVQIVAEGKKSWEWRWKVKVIRKQKQDKHFVEILVEQQ